MIKVISQRLIIHANQDSGFKYSLQKLKAKEKLFWNGSQWKHGSCLHKVTHAQNKNWATEEHQECFCLFIKQLIRKMLNYK